MGRNGHQACFDLGAEVTLFSKDSSDFLQGLSKHSNREWFTDHKNDYERYIKAPSEHFAAEMEQRLQTLTGHEYKSKLFRIYRDVRFSKDKTPYHSHQRISFFPMTKTETPPAWFFSLEKDHFILGTGLYGLQKQVLENWRKSVSGRVGSELTKVITAMEDRGLRINEADLKRVPSGFDSDHSNERLLRRKGLSVWMDFDDARPAYGEKGLTNVLAGFQTLRPIFDGILKIQK